MLNLIAHVFRMLFIFVGAQRFFLLNFSLIAISISINLIAVVNRLFFIHCLPRSLLLYLLVTVQLQLLLFRLASFFRFRLPIQVYSNVACYFWSLARDDFLAHGPLDVALRAVAVQLGEVGDNLLVHGVLLSPDPVGFTLLLSEHFGKIVRSVQILQPILNCWRLNRLQLCSRRLLCSPVSLSHLC